jgi:hypothetical protein
LLWFRVPFVGSMLALQASLLLYMLAGVAIGLVISSIARTQQQAMLGVFVIASPMVVLSGYAAPVENMPAVAEWIGRADPIRWRAGDRPRAVPAGHAGVVGRADRPAFGADWRSGVCRGLGGGAPGRHLIGWG